MNLMRKFNHNKFGEMGSNLAYEVSSAPYPVSSNQIDSYGYAYIDSETVQDIIDYNWIDIVMKTQFWNSKIMILLFKLIWDLSFLFIQKVFSMLNKS